MTDHLPDRVVAVTVTYADRGPLLTQVVAAARSEGVAGMIVVDNGSDWPVKEQLSAEFGEFVDVVEMGRNTGSAGGFAAGIKRSLELDADYVWLLDDDNRPETGCLDALLSAHQRLQSAGEGDHLAVLALRTAHRANLDFSHNTLARRNAFLRFHVNDVFRHAWRRTPWGKTESPREAPETLEMPAAPYGGLLLQRSTLDAIGLPREDFVLYADDLEFTHRIKEKGGRIVKVTNALVEDLEHSWDNEGAANSFAILLTQGSDLQAWYGVRNRVYFEYDRLMDNRLVFFLNAGAQLAILGLFALYYREPDRLRLVFRAARDGLAGRLGVNPQHPL